MIHESEKSGKTAESRGECPGAAVQSAVRDRHKEDLSDTAEHIKGENYSLCNAVSYIFDIFRTDLLFTHFSD